MSKDEIVRKIVRDVISALPPGINWSTWTQMTIEMAIRDGLNDYAKELKEEA